MCCNNYNVKKLHLNFFMALCRVKYYGIFYGIFKIIETLLDSVNARQQDHKLLFKGEIFKLVNIQFVILHLLGLSSQKQLLYAL